MRTSLNNVLRLILLVLGVFLYCSNAWAVTVYYFPASFDGNTQRPQEVSTQAGFAPICDGARLPGLDLTRVYAGVASCPSTSASGRLVQTVEYVFLVDDTTDLSPYMVNQLGVQNLLQASGERQIVRPSVVNFAAQDGREGFNILVVGEMAYRQVGTPQSWLAQLNGRFASDAVIAGSSAGSGEIFMLYHGSYYDAAMREIINPSLEKIVEFMSKQGVSAAPSVVSVSSSSGSSSSGIVTPTNNYIDMCRRNNVPIPPAWNPTSGSNQWQRRGVLPDPFIARGLANVEVWTFASTSPAGLCMALPRMRGSNINTDIEALGIICQSDISGKACFWDNVVRPSPDISSGQPVGTRDERLARRPPNRAKITGAATRNLLPTQMSDGYNLEENCTECHRGSNVFITRRYSHLDVSAHCSPTLDTQPASRYAPLSGTPSDPLWVNPTSTLQTNLITMGNDQCTICHDSNNEIVQPSLNYCVGIFDNIIGTNMPPDIASRSPCGSAAGSSSSGGGLTGSWFTSYREEVVHIANTCCNLPEVARLNAAERASYLPNLRTVATSGRCLTP